MREYNEILIIDIVLAHTITYHKISIQFRPIWQTNKKIIFHDSQKK